ncbi:MAG: hypothetical protein B7Y86_06190 [Brevundimonas subvibrioides]|uniref:DUF969 domain-containing protein n=1 Tax=Brevundimonas subvibrioides TaxID=74313 RepID=A0A258HLQ9_9CAUL|nr:DUF969 domain-containing protein [Brevundimonas subvibrioides]OYX57292.1 MAG: hypothetical protein B7Y86_06190 [Brevundimonas subvibrioides]
MLVLLGILVVVAGFVARINPLLVILAAAIVTGVCAAIAPGVSASALFQAGVATLTAFGDAFNDNRYFHVVWLILPVIGLLERAGLQERARMSIAKVRAASAGRLLIAYLILRQATSALGLTSLGGHPQMVRPLVAPMAEGAAEVEAGGTLPDAVRHRIRGMSAATDNIGLFFGEDIFIAIGSIILMVGFLEQAGIIVEPLQLSVWAIPTAIAAFLIHGARLLIFDRSIRKAISDARTETGQ